MWETLLKPLKLPLVQTLGICWWKPNSNTPALLSELVTKLITIFFLNLDVMIAGVKRSVQQKSLTWGKSKRMHTSTTQVMLLKPWASKEVFIGALFCLRHEHCHGTPWNRYVSLICAVGAWIRLRVNTELHRSHEGSAACANGLVLLEQIASFSNCCAHISCYYLQDEFVISLLGFHLITGRLK